nr:response regulator [cf. Phormidesmis sp. LEGE 11477]
MLVEDDYLLGRSMVRLLEASGRHRVRLTRIATDIFKYCESDIVELVLMDVNLPGILWQDKETTGVVLSRLLKSNPMTRHIPVVLLTANSEDVDKTHLMKDALADSVCAKSIKDADSFLSLLDRVIDSKSASRLGLSVS